MVGCTANGQRVDVKRRSHSLLPPGYVVSRDVSLGPGVSRLEDVSYRAFFSHSGEHVHRHSGLNTEVRG